MSGSCARPLLLECGYPLSGVVVSDVSARLVSKTGCQVPTIKLLSCSDVHCLGIFRVLESVPSDLYACSVLGLRWKRTFRMSLPSLPLFSLSASSLGVRVTVVQTTSISGSLTGFFGCFLTITTSSISPTTHLPPSLHLHHYISITNFHYGHLCSLPTSSPVRCR